MHAIWAEHQQVYSTVAERHSPISAPIMADVRIYDALQLGGLTKAVCVFSRTDNKFETPQTIARKSETTTHCRPLRVAQKAEPDREEKVVDMLRCVSQLPEREPRMSLGCGQRYTPVQRYPVLFVLCAR